MILIINCLFSIGKKGSSGVCGVEMWKKSTVGIPLSGKDYSNERAISLRFVRLILSQYKSENHFQNVTTMVTVANIVILDGRTACLA